MSARRLARELAIIVMPQLPRNSEKLGKFEITDLVDKAIHMLVDYARQNLKDAHAAITAETNELVSIEVEHKDNANVISMTDLKPVPLTTEQLRDQLGKLELAINLINEALDIPEMALSAGTTRVKSSCKKCQQVSEVAVERPHKEDVRDFVFRLIETYLDNKESVDEFIKRTRSKWRMDRMVSIDRDILRLACTEAFYMEDIPVNVAIAEAVNLSHRFADAKAAKFINGILGDMSEEAEAVRRMRRRSRNSQAVKE